MSAGVVAASRRRTSAFVAGALSAPLHFQADAQTQTAANNTALTQLTDQSSNGRHATKTAGTLTYLTAGINGHGGFKFASGAYCTTPTFTAIPSSTAITVFAVAQFAASTAQDLLAAASPTFNLELGTTASAWRLNRATDATGGTPDAAVHRLNWFLAASGATASYLTVDGTAVIGPSAAGFGAPTSWRVGASSSGFANFAGTIGELLIYAGALSAPEIASVQSYLTTKWS